MLTEARRGHWIPPRAGVTGGSELSSMSAGTEAQFSLFIPSGTYTPDMCSGSVPH